MSNLYKSEKLNLWDRIFNRYKKIPIKSGSEIWNRFYNNGVSIPNSDFSRCYTEYHEVDRLTGGYEIKKVYHN